MKLLNRSLIVLFFLAFVSCSSEFDPCLCYKDAIDEEDRSTLDQECQDLIKDMTNEDLKEADNKCFTDDASDLVGGGVL